MGIQKDERITIKMSQEDKLHIFKSKPVAIFNKQLEYVDESHSLCNEAGHHLSFIEKSITWGEFNRKYKNNLSICHNCKKDL